MRLNYRGFTLLEMLIAMALSSIVLLGAGKLFPALQHSVLLQYQKEAHHESLWQLAFSLGKTLQRTGYCHGTCVGEALTLRQRGACVLVQWDANSNGRWEPSGHVNTEVTGFRLRNSSLETLKGAASCEGNGWERVSDPEVMIISHFSVTRRARQAEKPLLEINLQAALKNGTQSMSLRHVVVGHNL